MASTFLKFAKTRELTLGDVIRLRDGLLAKGYDVTLLDRCEGGIDFRNDVGSHKDLRFSGLEGIGVSGHLDTATLQFAVPLQTVISKFVTSSPPAFEGNELRLKLTNNFSLREIRDVQDCVESSFGAIPDVINNRRFEDWSAALISKDDSADAVNIYLGFNLQSAISKWTTLAPRPAHDEEEAHLFKCWKCKSRYSYLSYSHCQA